MDVDTTDALDDIKTVGQNRREQALGLKTGITHSGKSLNEPRIKSAQRDSFHKGTLAFAVLFDFRQELIS